MVAIVKDCVLIIAYYLIDCQYIQGGLSGMFFKRCDWLLLAPKAMLDELMWLM